MKKSRPPRPLRSSPDSHPLRRSLPVLASAALLAGCSFSTAPGETAEATGGSSNVGTGGIQDIGSSGGIGLPYSETGGTGGFDDVGTGGAPPPPYEGLGGTTNQPEVGAAGSLGTADREIRPLENEESGT